jgi:hypothetical protein
MENFVIVCASSDFNTVKDAVIPLAAALIGAIAGTIGSSIITKKQTESATEQLLQRDEQDRRSQRARAARQVYIKLRWMTESVGNVRNQMTEMIQRANRDGKTNMLIHERLSIFPAIKTEVPITFSADELEIFISTQQINYFDQLLLASRRHSAFLTNLLAFAELKTEFNDLTSQLGRTKRDPQGIAITKMRVPQSVANHIKVKSENLEFFAKEMVGLTNEWYDYISEVMTGFEPATVDFFDIGHRLGSTPISEDLSCA